MHATLQSPGPHKHLHLPLWLSSDVSVEISALLSLKTHSAGLPFANYLEVSDHHVTFGQKVPLVGRSLESFLCTLALFLPWLWWKDMTRWASHQTGS